MCFACTRAAGIQNVHITPSLQLSNTLSSLCFGIFNVFCGFLRPQPLIPAGWIWLHYLIPLSWTLVRGAGRGGAGLVADWSACTGGMVLVSATALWVEVLCESPLLRPVDGIEI